MIHFVNLLSLLSLFIAFTSVSCEKSDLFFGAEYINAAADAGPYASPVETQFQQDVKTKFDKSDPTSTIVGAKKATLDCVNLALKTDLESLSITWEGKEITALKVTYKYYQNLQKRHVWIGDLQGQYAGTMSVVWNDACDSDVFHLSVVLNDNSESNKFALKSVACTDNNAPPGCTWIVKVKMPARDELEHPHRNLAVESPSLQTAQLDDRIREHKVQKKSVPQPKDLVVEAALDTDAVLKVLWLYTPKARDTWGDAKIRSIISAGVTTANLALQNSKINLRIECVGMFATEGYYTNNHQQCLSDLTAGRVPGVHQKRDQYKADLVQLVIEDGSFCGYGNVMTGPSVGFAPYGYSTVFSQCFSTFSHIHEIGHNLGSTHDRVSAGGTGGSYTYSFGHRYCDAPGSFRSVMAYSCASSTRVPYFSSPNVYYLGKPTGKYDADNVRTINANKWYACNFRQG